MNLSEYDVPKLVKKKFNGKRATLIQFIIDQINSERPTKYKKGEKWVVVGKIESPKEKKMIALKLAHLADYDLEWLLSTGKDYKQRNGSFGKFFFGALRKK